MNYVIEGRILRPAMSLAVVVALCGSPAWAQGGAPVDDDPASRGAEDPATEEAAPQQLTPADAQHKQAELLPLHALRTFADVFSHIRGGYVEDVDDKTLLVYAIEGMLGGLDPHSLYLTGDDFDNFQTATSGEFTGLGLEVGMEDGFVKVISPIDDTPAQRAGIESGDFILKLDNHPLKGLSLNEAVDMMRGPRGSSIDVTISREGVNQPFTLTLVRDRIRVVSVRQRWLEPGYGYLRVAQFQRHTGSDLGKALRKLRADAPFKGLVLDLRNNPGGVLHSSVDVSDHFLDGGTVVYTRGRHDSTETRYNATPGDTTGGAPLVVLINGGSASAAEIVAGALQDHRRAVVMGSRSFGKGSVQTILQLSEDQAIKLTTAHYYTPNGRSIQAEGIIPDIEVERAQVTAIDRSPYLVSEADLAGRLDNPQRRGTRNSNADAEGQPVADKLLGEDNQLHEALTLLKGIHILGMYSPGPNPSPSAER